MHEILYTASESVQSRLKFVSPGWPSRGQLDNKDRAFGPFRDHVNAIRDDLAEAITLDATS